MKKGIGGLTFVCALLLALSCAAMFGCGDTGETGGSYKIIYKINGGSGDDFEETFGKRYPISETTVKPTREGFEFVGWSVNDDSYKRFEFNGYLESDVTLYAYYKPEGEDVKEVSFYSVYDEDNGANDYFSVFGRRKDKLPPVKDPVREGYTFGGWSRFREFVVYTYLEDTTFDSGSVYTAIWLKTGSADETIFNAAKKSLAEYTGLEISELSNMDKNFPKKYFYRFNEDKEATAFYSDRAGYYSSSDGTHEYDQKVWLGGGKKYYAERKREDGSEKNYTHTLFDGELEKDDYYEDPRLKARFADEIFKPGFTAVEGQADTYKKRFDEGTEYYSDVFLMVKDGRIETYRQDVLYNGELIDGYRNWTAYYGDESIVPPVDKNIVFEQRYRLRLDVEGRIVTHHTAMREFDYDHLEGLVPDDILTAFAEGFYYDKEYTLPVPDGGAISMSEDLIVYARLKPFTGERLTFMKAVEDTKKKSGMLVTLVEGDGKEYPSLSDVLYDLPRSGQQAQYYTFVKGEEPGEIIAENNYRKAVVTIENGLIAKSAVTDLYTDKTVVYAIHYY